MTWLLAQGEHLPAILVAIVASVLVCRLLFAKREECQTITAQIKDLQASDDRHMGSVTRAHARIDEFFAAIHQDMVRLFDRADTLERTERARKDPDDR
jgi:uncharacterized membrane-anchored protein YhcB (DUF1043 family)